MLIFVFEQYCNLLPVSHRAIVTCLHSFRVNVDRLPAARDKALKIIGSLLRANMNLLSGRDCVRRSCQIDCTIRRRVLRRSRCGLIGTLTDNVEEWIVHRTRTGVVGVAGRHYLCCRSSKGVGDDRLGSRNGNLSRSSSTTVRIDKGLDLRNMLNDEF